MAAKPAHDSVHACEGKIVSIKLSMPLKGCRRLAPGDLRLAVSRRFARRPAGGHCLHASHGRICESFSRLEIVEQSEQEGYMFDLAAAICTEVDVPVIVAGRLVTDALAAQVIIEITMW